MSSQTVKKIFLFLNSIGVQESDGRKYEISCTAAKKYVVNNMGGTQLIVNAIKKFMLTDNVHLN